MDNDLYDMNVDMLVIKDMLIALDLPFVDVFEINVGRYIERLYNIYLLTWKKGSRDVMWIQYLRTHYPKDEQQKDLHERILKELDKENA